MDRGLILTVAGWVLIIAFTLVINWLERRSWKK